MKKRKILISLIIISIIVTAILSTILFMHSKSKTENISNEIKRTLSYKELSEDDKKIDNCDYVYFNAYFAKDTNGDGEAERYNGTCNYIKEEPRIYFDIGVLTDGRLEEGKIEINGKNFDLSLMQAKNEVIAKDYFNDDTKLIELNTISAGTTDMFVGNIISRIDDNIYNYSVEGNIDNNINVITFSGKWVSTDNQTTININKKIPLTVDWYGYTSTRVKENISTSHNIKEAVGENELNLEFEVGYKECGENLLIQKQVTEIVIPNIVDEEPLEVICTSHNCKYNFDKKTKILTIAREAEIDEEGYITSSISRENSYNIQVKYSIAAYQKIDSKLFSLSIPTKGYYYGFNNTSDEYWGDNPYISSAERSYTHIWGDNPNTFQVYLGKSVYDNDTKKWHQVISKEEPLKIYNNIGKEDTDVDEYTVQWNIITGSTIEYPNIKAMETKMDQFLNSKAEYIDMKEYINVKSIKFYYAYEMLNEYGWIKIYDAYTNELLDTLTSENWNQEYKVTKPVKGIKIETSEANENTLMSVYITKEIDDDKLVENYSKEEFCNLEYIYNYGKCEVYNNISKEDSTSISFADYEETISDVTFDVSPNTMTNQETKKITFTISTQTSNYNESLWKDGKFVIELPEEILKAEIKDVRVSDSDVEVIFSGVNEEEYNGIKKQYIKIYTQNEIEKSYDLEIDVDITGDSRKAGIEKNINLYAENKLSSNYKETLKIKDVLDINGNGNKDEYILHRAKLLKVLAPTALITSQYISNFDNTGNDVVSPQTAIYDKADTDRTADINISITNNYSGVVNKAKIVGKIPFKGNTYQINKLDLGSTCTFPMKNTGITLPEALVGIAKVYYSVNENVTQDVEDNTNNWKKAEEVEDWSKIRTYLIDLSRYELQTKEQLIFSYQIELGNDINYNDIAYSTHAIYFNVNLGDGNIKTSTEVNRLGIMIAKKYDVSITKYKHGTSTKAQGATYKIESIDGQNNEVGITNKEGNVVIKGLYIDKEYLLKEIQTPNNYVLNTDEIRFKLVLDSEGKPKIELVGNLRNEAIVSNVNGQYTLQLEVEDIAKYDLKIKKIANTGENLNGVKFRLRGGSFGNTGRTFSTDKNGNINISNLLLDTKYSLEETKSDGYYVNDNLITFTVVRENNNKLKIISENINLEDISIDEKEGVDKANLNIKVINEKIPEYSLNIHKTSADTQEPLKDTQFKLTSIDTNNVTFLKTDENGNITFNNLYQYVSEKDITGEYILQEIVATSGYITDTTEVKFKVEKVGEALNITFLEGQNVVVSSNSDGESITFNIENKPIFKVKKYGDNGALLPNTWFRITDIEGNPVKDINGNIIGERNGESILITDEKGEFTANLPQGKYKLVELSPPYGYELPPNEADRTYYIGIGESVEASYEDNYAQWLKAINGNGFSNINDVKATGDGGYVTIGAFQGEVDINQDNLVDEESYGGLDSLIAKFDQDGNELWHNRFGNIGADNFNSIDITSDGEYIIGGYETTSDFEDGVILKLDNAGNEIWRKYIKGNLKDEIKSVKVLSNQDIVVAGRFFSDEITFPDKRISNFGKNNGFIACYTSDGNYKWSQGINGTEDIDITSITETSLGIVITANIFGEINVNGNAISSNGEQDAVLMAFSLNGEYLWSRVIGGDKIEILQDVTTDIEGNIVAVGGYSSNFEISEPSGRQDTFEVSYDGQMKGFVLKYAPNGEYLSNYIFKTDIEYGSEEKFNSIVATIDGGVLVSGRFSGDYRNLVDSEEKYIIEGTNNGLLIKLDKYIEEIEWIKQTTVRNSYIERVDKLKDNTYIAVGNFYDRSTCVGAPWKLETEYLDQQGYIDSFMTKIGRTMVAPEVPELQELEITNQLREQEITTEIGKNSDGRRTGGTITGRKTSKENINLVEKVKFGYESTQIIEIKPEENYIIHDIKINNIDYNFMPDDDGNVTIPIFESVEEDFHITVVFEKNMSNVLVHHYIKNREGDLTETSLVDDEYLTGKVDENYSTIPRRDIEGYSLAKEVKKEGYELVEINGENYSLPKNKSGKFQEGQTVVTYYYEEIPLNLTVHHYLVGTENKLAPDEIDNTKYRGDEYNAAPNLELLENYDVVENLTVVTPPWQSTSGILENNTTVTYYYKIKDSAGVVVHHYLLGTTEKVVEDEFIPENGIPGLVGQEYTTNLTDKLPVNCEVATNKQYYSDEKILAENNASNVEELLERLGLNPEEQYIPNNYTGNMTAELIEVKYYYVFKQSELVDNKIEKTGTEYISSNIERISYKIKYNTTIDKYIGNAQIVIVDKLPQSIDVQQSYLDGGVYDSEKNTITWTDLITDIDTFTSGQPYTVDTEKNISILYTGFDYSVDGENVDKSIINTVEGSTRLLKTNQKSELATDTHETKYNFSTGITVTKVWNDNNNENNRRPNSIKIVLSKVTEETSEILEATESEEPIIEPEISEETEENVQNNDEEILNEESIAEEETIENSENISEKQEELEDNIASVKEEIESNVDTIGDLEIDANNTKEVDENNTISEIIAIEEPIIEQYNLNQLEEEKNSNTEIEPLENAENIEKIDETVQNNDTNIQYISEYILEFTEGENTKSYVFEGLPKYDESGNKINYVVSEEEINLGDLLFYTHKIEETSDNCYTITNTYGLPTENAIELAVLKTWKDNSNKKNLRPDKIKLVLVGSNNGKEIIRQEALIPNSETEIIDSNNWKYIFKNLPKSNTDGSEIVYTISEENVNEFYTSNISTINENNECTIVNALIIQNTDITKTGTSVINSWNDKVTYKIDYTAELDENYSVDDLVNIVITDTLPYKFNNLVDTNLAGGVPGEDGKTITWIGKYNTKEKTITWDDGKTYENVEVKNNVQEISFSKTIEVVYEDIPVLCDMITNNVSGRLELPNGLSDTKKAEWVTETKFIRNIKVNKIWEGDESNPNNPQYTRPETINVTLKEKDDSGNITDIRNDIVENIEEFNPILTITPKYSEEKPNEQIWEGSWENLPKYDNDANKKEINYTIIEDNVEGYYSSTEASVTDENEILFTITNHKLGSITVTKVDSRKEELKLPDAEFELKRVIKEVNEEGKINWRVPEEGSEEYFVTTGTTGDDGTYTFENLKYGFYQLEEKGAPDGYRVSKEEIPVIEVKAENTEVAVTVKNDKKYSLPLTGGYGTNIIRNAGILIASIFAIILTNRKKVVPVKRSKIIEKPVKRKK